MPLEPGYLDSKFDRDCIQGICAFRFCFDRQPVHSLCSAKANDSVLWRHLVMKKGSKESQSVGVSGIDLLNIVIYFGIVVIVVARIDHYYYCFRREI